MSANRATWLSSSVAIRALVVKMDGGGRAGFWGREESYEKQSYSDMLIKRR